ncbi:transmembrane protein, putative (macronuclear) [Tetrahymena thermophila SB210]|uniref:Transmembrane protein, putative n=1 Tax=Tetrahymena thermophila (strain SB210) TaxID=312017 RepID=W7WZN8_TETTS|nr:transmembrane protein, putative [Tetrahymena thermophila SB210]EWS71062.1 transmembrane protein, putative [Tetrahymena thermophila SB210]|eukprot:XP_012656403.1 transmembrane protein, putative [Tetrahymena thermophila SB210]
MTFCCIFQILIQIIYRTNKQKKKQTNKQLFKLSINIKMEIEIIHGFFFTMVKLNSGIQFYFFYQYINQDQKSYIYCFISFYIIERLFSWITDMFFIKRNNLESILILILNLAQLDEFYFMISQDRRREYLEEGILEKSVITFLFDIPLYLMSIVWVLKVQFMPLNMVFVSILLLLIYIGLFTTALSIIGSLELNIYKLFRFKCWFFQYLYSYFQFFTYFWSLCLIWNYYNLQYYFLAVYSVLLVLLIKHVWLRLQNNLQTMEKYTILIIIIIKQLLHIVFRYRKKKHSSFSIQNKFGYKIFNSMIIFELLIKLYLLIAFWIVFQKTNNNNNNNNQQLYSFKITVLIMIVISFLILLFQSIDQVIINQYKYKDYIELESIQEFIKFDKNSKDIKNNYVKYIQIFDIFYNEETYGISIIKDILFEYESIEIIGRDFNKKKILNNKYFYSVEIEFIMKAQQILDVIQTQKVISQIQSVYLKLQNDGYLYDLYKFWIDNYIEISLYSNYDYRFYQLINNIKQQMQSAISQLIIYQKFIFPQMIVNPHFVYYDLYD